MYQKFHFKIWEKKVINDDRNFKTLMMNHKVQIVVF
jgi:hypothetical protein